MIDPVTGNLLVAEQDQISNIPKDQLFAESPTVQRRPDNTHFIREQIATQGASGLAFDAFTGELFFTDQEQGSLSRLDRETGQIETIVAELLDPTQLLALQRAGVPCKDSSHLFVVEQSRGTFVQPATRRMISPIELPGLRAVTFLPDRNPVTETGGLLTAEFLGKQGQVSEVELPDLYGLENDNPPEVAACLLDCPVPVSGLNGSAEILFPADGAVFSLQGGESSLPVPIIGRFSAEFDYELSRVGTIETVATLVIPETQIEDCRISAPAVFASTYQVGRETGSVFGQVTVPSTDARFGILPDPCDPGQMIFFPVDPSSQPFLDLIPLPNSLGAGDGTGQLFLSFDFDGLSGTLDFPLGLPPSTGFGRFQLFPPGVYTMILIVEVGGIEVARTDVSFSVQR